MYSKSSIYRRKNQRGTSRGNDRRRNFDRYDRREMNKKNFQSKKYDRDTRQRSNSRERNDRKRRSRSKDYSSKRYSPPSKSRSRSRSKNNTPSQTTNTSSTTTATATTNTTTILTTNSALSAFTNPPIINTANAILNINGNVSNNNPSNISYDQIRRNTITNNKVAQLEKMGIDLMAQNKKLLDANVTIPSYYNPGIVNPAKYAEQVQKRKLLWGNKKIETPKPNNAANDTESKANSSIPNNWENAKFSDDKVASKFMRLMGIKDVQLKQTKEVKDTETHTKTDMIKKQEELFSTMEQQYEVARQVTHTMRGVGLGFGSQPRQF